MPCIFGHQWSRTYKLDQHGVVLPRYKALSAPGPYRRHCEKCFKKEWLELHSSTLLWMFEGWRPLRDNVDPAALDFSHYDDRPPTVAEMKRETDEKIARIRSATDEKIARIRSAGEEALRKMRERSALGLDRDSLE